MRYLPLTDVDRREMLAKIGVKSVDDLFKDVPASARLPAKIAGLPDHWGETYATADVIEYDGVRRVKVGREFLLKRKDGAA